MIRLTAIATGILVFSALLSASITTTTTLTSVTPAAPVFGKTVTLTASVSPATAPGLVSFMDGGVLVGTGKLNASGIAQATTLALSAGTHSIVAVYGGNTSGGYLTSHSAALPYIVTATEGSGFATAANYPAGSSAWSVAVGDFNGDGKADLAVANNGGANVSILLGYGNGAFQTAVNYTVGSFPASVAIGDFNADGKLDLAVANNGPGANNVSVLLGKGDGTFQPAVNYAAGSLPLSVAVADINEDGMADLVVANDSSNNVSVLLGNGDGTFQAPANHAVGTAPSFVAVGDFDNNGIPDLVTANFGSGANSVSVLAGIGGGSFQPAVSYAAGAGPISIAVGDFNSDGNQDLAVANLSGANVSVLLGGGTGGFNPPVNYTVGTNPHSVAVGDFNGDGKLDLATADQGGNVSVLFGNGNGTFQPVVNQAAGTTPQGVAVGDFNGDGIADLAVANLGSNNVSILLGAAAPTTSTSLISSANPSTYGSAVTLTAAVVPSSAPGTVEFFNGAIGIGSGTLVSGEAQITTGTLPTGTNTLRAQYNGDPGVWQSSLSNTVHQTVTPVPSSGFAPAINLACCGYAPVAVVAQDFNGDGKVDLAVLDEGGNSIDVMLGKGNGTFSPAVDYGVGMYEPGSIAVGDFNHDGILDLLAVSGEVPSGVSILLGTGSGTFGKAIFHQINTPPPDAGAVADFNHDGYPDVAVANDSATNVGVLFGNGDGTLANEVLYPAGGLYPTDITVGDFNGDGLPDIAATIPGSASPNISVLLNNGNGTFGSPALYPTHGTAASVATGDFNGDGKLDIAVGDGGYISILLGKGDGTFQTALFYPAGVDFSLLITVGDFNGDGRLDVAASNYNLNQVFILMGNGDGSLQSPVVYTVGTNPEKMAVADFNGDGVLDLAVANHGSANVSILLGIAGTPAVPSPVSVVPGSGSGYSQTFTFTFSDPAGYTDLSVLDILINNYLDGIGACYVALVPVTASSGYLYLVADAGGGYVSGTPVLLPSGGSFGNSQCTINGTGSSFSGSGNTLTVTLNITFNAGFAGNKIFYMAARSATQNSGWQALGTWDVPGPAVVGPGVGGVTPGKSVTMGQTYTFTFTDSFGYSDLAVLDILTNSFLDGISACYVAYVPTSASTGYLYLVDNAGDGGYAAGSPILLSSGGTLSNSQCSINTAGSSASASGNTLNLNLAITFSSSFAGNQVFYLASRNNSTGNSGWQAVGSVTVP
jgi:hypothetical protein